MLERFLKYLDRYKTYDENKNKVASFTIHKGKDVLYESKLDITDGVHPLIFKYEGKGKLSFFKFVLG